MKKYQAAWSNGHSAAHRRKFRESQQVKDLRNDSKRATSETQRRDIHATLLRAKRHTVTTLRRVDEINKFSAGASITKSKKLFSIRSMLPPGPSSTSDDASASLDTSEWASWLKDEYEDKWRAQETYRLEPADTFLVEKHGLSRNFTVDEIYEAFVSLKRPARCDHYGVALTCLWNVFVAREAAFTECLNKQVSIVEGVSFWRIKGRLLSKKQGPCRARQTRAIMPMPCTLMLVDTIIAKRFCDLLSSLPAAEPCFLEASLKGRSTNDVVFAARLVVEKGLGCRGQVAICAADIERFYDGVDPITVADYPHLSRLAGMPQPHRIARFLAIDDVFHFSRCYLTRTSTVASCFPVLLAASRSNLPSDAIVGLRVAMDCGHGRTIVKAVRPRASTERLDKCLG